MNELETKAFIFGSIFTLANKMQALGDKIDKHITVKQWLLIASVYKFKNETPSISQIANILGNSRQNIKKMVTILEKQGFVEIEKDPADKRMIRVKLTEKCLKHLKSREVEELKFINNLFSDFDYGELRQIAFGISKLESNISIMERDYK